MINLNLNSMEEKGVVFQRVSKKEMAKINDLMKENKMVEINLKNLAMLEKILKSLQKKIVHQE